MSKEPRQKLGEMLRELKLPGVNAIYGEAASRAEKRGESSIATWWVIAISSREKPAMSLSATKYAPCLWYPL